MRRAVGFTRPCSRGRRPRTRIGNIALVPASQLASMQRWQQTSNELPAGDILLVVPRDNLRLRVVGKKLDDTLRRRGRRSRIETV
jgi:hypothetical protein